MEQKKEVDNGKVRGYHVRNEEGIRVVRGTVKKPDL